MFGDPRGESPPLERIELGGGELNCADRSINSVVAREPNTEISPDRLVAHPPLHGDHQRPADLRQWRSVSAGASPRPAVRVKINLPSATTADRPRRRPG